MEHLSRDVTSESRQHADDLYRNGKYTLWAIRLLDDEKLIFPPAIRLIIVIIVIIIISLSSVAYNLHISQRSHHNRTISHGDLS
jgi:hypothetical protein